MWWVKRERGQHRVGEARRACVCLCLAGPPRGLRVARRLVRLLRVPAGPVAAAASARRWPCRRRTGLSRSPGQAASRGARSEPSRVSAVFSGPSRITSRNRTCRCPGQVASRQGIAVVLSGPSRITDTSLRRRGLPVDALASLVPWSPPPFPSYTGARPREQATAQAPRWLAGLAQDGTACTPAPSTHMTRTSRSSGAGGLARRAPGHAQAVVGHSCRGRLS